MSTDVETKTEPTLYTKREQAHYQLICTKNAEVAKLAVAVQVAKERFKAAKERWEAAASDLHETIDAGPDPQPKLPGMDDERPDDWKILALAELDLPAGIVDTLTDAGFATLGELSDRMDHDSWWQLVDGIGEKSAEKVADAFAAFWANHPEYCTEPRPTRIRIVKDIEDGDLHEGEEYDVIAWDGGEPVIQPEGSPKLYLGEVDWEAVTDGE